MALLQITEPGEAVDPHERKRGAGIDLGTTNSLIAAVRAGVTETLPDAAGHHLLPSAVRYLEGGERVVGADALAALAADPLNTVVSVKRYMGRGLDDVDTLGEQQPYEFEAGDGMPKIRTVAGAVSPVEVSAEILKSLATRARDTLGGRLDGVVITVPAYFDDAQRQATRDAARLADLNVLRLVNEPTAAALAYGLDSGDEGVFVVYDLGGGTFDVSLLRLSRGVFEVMATGGNTALGGDDFDHAIVDHVLARLPAAERSLSELRGLYMHARRIKEALSGSDVVTIDLREDGIDFEGEMTRAEFDALIDPLVRETVRTCRRTLRDAGITPDDVDGVVMVGGSTRVPLVQSRVAELFDRDPLASIDPDRVVALGAAAQADVLVGNKSGEDMLLLDVLPLSLGLETMGGLAEKIIHRNTPIPVARAQEFTTYKDGQSAMLIHVVQGERERVDDCRSLARFELHGIPPMVAGAAKIRVHFQVDADGLLSVSAEETSTGVKTGVTVKPSYGLGEEEITRMLKASIDHAAEDVEARRLTEARVEAQRVIDALAGALVADGEALLSAEERSLLEAALEKLGGLLAADDPREINRGVELLAAASDEFAARRMDAAVRAALAGSDIDTLEAEFGTEAPERGGA